MTYDSLPLDILPGITLVLYGANVLYGAHDGSVSDPLNIRWSNSEDYTVWTADPSNTAGSIQLAQN